MAHGLNGFNRLARISLNQFYPSNPCSIFYDLAFRFITAKLKTYEILFHSG